MNFNKHMKPAPSPKQSTKQSDQPDRIVIPGGLTPEQFQAEADQLGQEIVDSLNKTVLARHGASQRPKVFGGLTPEQFQARAQQMGQEIVNSLNKTVLARHGASQRPKV